MLFSRSLLAICFIYECMYGNAKLQIYPSLHLCPLVTLKFVIDVSESVSIV